MDALSVQESGECALLVSGILTGSNAGSLEALVASKSGGFLRPYSGPAAAARIGNFGGDFAVFGATVSGVYSDGFGGLRNMSGAVL